MPKDHPVRDVLAAAIVEQDCKTAALRPFVTTRFLTRVVKAAVAMLKKQLECPEQHWAVALVVDCVKDRFKRTCTRPESRSKRPK
ncbi:MAG: hypothetical protein R3C68_16670 [Myxococcota bacterium]